MSYTIVAGNVQLVIEDWQPDSYFDMETEIVLPVSVRAYVSRSGGAQYGLTIRRRRTDGDPF